MKKVLLLLFVSGALPALAQQQTQSVWLASFNTIKLSDRYSLHAELQLRSTDNAEQIQTILPRVGVNRHFGKRQIATIGYAWIPNRVSLSGENGLLPEHRLWQQYIFNQPLGKSLSLQHRFRLEERWLPVATVQHSELKQDGTAYTTRIRYFARTILPWKKPGASFSKGIFTSLQNEVFINLTDRQHVNGKWFDQNRAYVAMGYRLSTKIDLELGYLNQYIERREGLSNIVNHVGQIAVYTRL